MRRQALVLAGFGVLLAGCGGSSTSGTPTLPVITAARTYKLVDFRPSGIVRPGKPVTVSFTIQQPNGRPLTDYKTGPGPHTGVHLIMVRRDLATIIHRHPPIDRKTGRCSITVVFSKPGPYRVVIDAYPAVHGVIPNFQLFTSVRVSGAYHPQPLPPPRSVDHVDGFTFTLHGHPHLQAIQAAFMTATVTDPQGKLAHFEPWYGALAHAIFFRKGTLDYFHTHICAPHAPGCTSILAGTKVTGVSTTPGKLTIGVLVPIPGTWELFLQCQVNHRVMTAPFTLIVH